MKQFVALTVALGMAAAVYAGGEECKDAAKAGTCPASSAAAAKGTCPASNAKLAKAEYKVTGMTCGACEEKVTKALAAIEGVCEPKACAESKVAKISYDPKKVKDEQVIAAINKLGFKVEAEKVDLKVDGMTCGGCSAKVSNALAALDGVKEKAVCHEGKNAVVTFDPKKVTRDQVIAAIDKTGFKVVQ